MIKGKCLDCKHYQRGEMYPLNGQPIPSSCGIGNNEAFDKWWKENGKKPYDEADDTPCYEPTESTIRLTAISDKLDELGDKVGINLRNQK
jgi:hypothetical protein